MSLPKYIALCGAPESGKSTAQHLLREEFGVMPIDDGLVLREAGMKLYGLTWQQVSTQEGKLEYVELNDGRRCQVRELLGELGRYHENQFGMNFMPFSAIRSLSIEARNHLRSGGSLSFGSVRRDQADFYRKLGGICIAVRRPKSGPMRAQFSFDDFNPDMVDHWIDNVGTLSDLREKVRQVCSWIKH